MDVNQQRKNLKEIIEREVLVRAKDGFYIAEHPANADAWLMDFRRVLLKPEVLRDYLTIFRSTFAARSPFQVCGLEVAAVPLIGAIVADSTANNTKGPINGFFIRKSRKKSGLLRMIEGTIIPGIPVIIVDDLMNRGGSIERQVKILEELGHTVTAVFTILRFRDPSFYEPLTKRGIEIVSIFDLNDLESTTGLKNLVAKNEVPVPRPFEIKWYFKSPEARYQFVIPKSAPVVDTEHIYFGSDSGIFWALRKATGEVAWKYRIPFGGGEKKIFSSPCLHNGRVYFGAYDGNLYALDATTGDRAWVYFDADWIGSSPTVSKKHNLVFVGLEYGLPGKRGGVAAIDTDSGREMWKFVSSELTHGSPGYSEVYDMVVCGSNDGVVNAFEAANGKILWQVRTGAPVRYSVAFHDERGLVTFGSEDGNLYIVDVRTGTVEYVFMMKFGMYSTPLIVGDRIYAASLDKHIYCVDITNGTEIWKFATRGRVYASPAYAFGKIYVGSNDGCMYELDPLTGKNTALHRVTERITNKIAFDEAVGHIYLPTYANEIYCLEKKVTDSDRSI